MTETDILALGCILLALACAGLCVYAWQEHMQAIHHRIRAEEQAMWADHFQAAADQCAAVATAFEIKLETPDIWQENYR